MMLRAAVQSLIRTPMFQSQGLNKSVAATATDAQPNMFVLLVGSAYNAVSTGNFARRIMWKKSGGRDAETEVRCPGAVRCLSALSSQAEGTTKNRRALRALRGGK